MDRDREHDPPRTLQCAGTAGRRMVVTDVAKLGTYRLIEYRARHHRLFLDFPHIDHALSNSGRRAA